ncbi:hypothetical protein FHS07_001989 [Microbacterium proteolyticum]|uniref:Uncharacterized protein n=1 Tax=Microbacterium proteolyticum TaxID=1572644 RepID=A0A7W5CIF8_9MICO|nr:hypothetical protein [Microbacterium proteolyticum]MBB3158293.1 hypothetical protein [Microbacterium proteolyticum]
MVATNADSSRAYELFGRLEQNAPAGWMDNREWVHLALTHIVLLMDEDELVYAQVGLETSGGGLGSLAVFTETSLLVARPDDADGKTVTTTLVARSAIDGLEVGGGEPIVYNPDGYESRYLVMSWPGTLTASVSYRGLAEPVKLSGSGVSRSDRKKPGEIVALLRALKRDLLKVSTEAGSTGA